MPRLRLALVVAAALTSSVAAAQTGSITTPAPIAPRAIGHISFYTNTSQLKMDDGTKLSGAEFVTNVNYLMPEGEGNGTEYSIDFRHASYVGNARQTRISIYDGYIGQRFAGGLVKVRFGEVWVTDLGGLGSVAGVLFEFRQPQTKSGMGRWRFGGFGGLEPEPYRVGLVQNIKKYGFYSTLEGAHGRRSTFGYVRVQDGALTERSVVTFSNFLAGAQSRLFLYQAGEYDLSGPAGQGSGGLSYLFLNARGTLSNTVEVQGLYHRGRSIDTRSITDDILNGRPLPVGALDAFLYQSMGGRVSLHVSKTMRVNAGYTVDRNNRDSASTGRLTVGFYASDLAKTGLDVTVNESRLRRPDSQYNALYLSVGRQIGRRLYLSGDYSSSVNIAHFTRSDGVTVELQPKTRQFTISSVFNAGRHLSILTTWDETRDDTSTEWRLLAGITYRIR